jgi:SAM-dependent methyltransferase
LELVVPLAPTPVAEKYVTQEELDQEQEKYPLDLYMCRDCSHVQLLDVVDARFLYDKFTYKSAKTKALVEHFEECAQRTCARYSIAPGSLVVDVGSNDGSFLRCFQSRGLRVLGIDPATEIAQEATAAGILTLPDFLTLDLARRLRQEHGAASVVCAFNVFAHADDLGGLLDSIREMLAPNGVFVFEVSYLLDVLDRMLLGTIFHEHMSYHAVKPMVQFLLRHGLELIDLQRVMIQGGSLIGTAQFAGGPHPSTASVQELLTLERERELDRPETLKKFAAKLQDFNRQLGTLMVDLKRQGKTVWGFGAARSGTTLISQMGLGKIISAIVDDSPEKQNKYSPGDHIPILPTRALYERKPDYTFILAWIHTQKILENNQAYLEQGGHFILCFPEVRVIGAGGEIPS